MENVLDVELVLYIFELATRTGEHDDWKRLMALSHVSRRWRSTLLAYASVWRQISVPIGIHEEREKEWDRCYTWLERSRSALIDISLCVTSSGHIWDSGDRGSTSRCECTMPSKTLADLVVLIRRNINRCSSLLLDYIHVDDAQAIIDHLADLPAQPTLRSFSLGAIGSRSKHKTPGCSEMILGGSWTNICHLRVYNARHFVIPDFRNLTTLHYAPRDWSVHGVTVPNFLLILEQNPQLEELDIAGVTSIFPTHHILALSGKLYVMQHLKRLYIWVRCVYSLAMIMAHVSIPSIEFLGITIDHIEEDPEEQEACYDVDTPSHMEFPHNITYPGTVVPFLDLKYFRLRSIDLGNPPLKLAYDILIRSPQLESIAVDNWCHKIDMGSLSDLLISPIRSIIPLRRLQLKDFIIESTLQIVQISEFYIRATQSSKLDFLELKRCFFHQLSPLDIPLLLDHFRRIKTSYKVVSCPQRLQSPFNFVVIPMYDRWEVTDSVSYGDAT